MHLFLKKLSLYYIIFLTILPTNTALDVAKLLQNIFDFQHSAISFKIDQLTKFSYIWALTLSYDTY